MKKVYQSTGNCLQACVASILECSLKDVPNFVSFSGIEWWDNLYVWCIEKGYGLILIKTGTHCLVLNSLVIAVAKVKNSEERHAVILKCELESKGKKWHWVGKVVHDPNPKKPEIEEFEEYIIINQEEIK